MLCEAIEAGVNYADAAAIAKVSNSTLSNWRNRGAELDALIQESQTPLELSQNDKAIWDFWQRFTAAEAQGAVNMATVVYNEGLRNPDYALKWLERRRSAEWALRQQHDVTTGGQAFTRFVIVPEDTVHGND